VVSKRRGATGRVLGRSALISPGATTHAFNQHQHVTFLPFTPASSFVKAADRRLRVRATWRDDFLPSAVFDFSIDLVRWRVRK
jgi:hypothetical protein